MGVRPPDNDDLEEPDVIEFGIAALDARLEAESVSYPVTADELRREYGDVEIPYDASGQSVDLATVLKRADRRQFDSEQDLLNAAHPVFERLRARNPSGILGQLRSLLPF